MRRRSSRERSRRRPARILLACSRRLRPPRARRSCEMKSRTLVIAAPGVAIAAIATASVVAQVPPSIDELLTRVGERIAEYYRRAQNVICIERSTVQPIGYNYSPDGFSRT